MVVEVGVIAIYFIIGMVVGPTAVSYLKFGDSRFEEQVGCGGFLIAVLFWPLCWALGLLKEIIDPFFRA